MQTFLRAAFALFLLGAGNLCHAQKQGAEPSAHFEVATIRIVPEKDVGFFSQSPEGSSLFTIKNASLRLLIAIASGISSTNIEELPPWADDQYYNISAKLAGEPPYTKEQTRGALQQLLQERLGLKVHHTSQWQSGYALTAATRGVKLVPTKNEAAHAYLLPHAINAARISMKGFAGVLALAVKQPVLDKTELSGEYDFAFEYAPLDGSDSPYPSIFTALDTNYGLKLHPEKIPVEALVVDAVNRTPTEE